MMGNPDKRCISEQVIVTTQVSVFILEHPNMFVCVHVTV